MLQTGFLLAVRRRLKDLEEVMIVYEDVILAVSKVANMLLALKAGFSSFFKLANGDYRTLPIKEQF